MAAAEVDEKQESVLKRQPAIFINHGGGPMPLLQMLDKDKKPLTFHGNIEDQTPIINSCKTMGKLIKKYKPTAILIISAHWVQDTPTVIYQKKPSLLYDYYNFDPISYHLSFQSSCDIDLTQKLVDILTQNGIQNVTTSKDRGYAKLKQTHIYTLFGCAWMYI